MGRSRNYDREHTLLDRLKRENSQLKRENSRMRKENDRLKNLRGLVTQQTQEAQTPVKTKRDWTCWECARGIMKLILLPRRDGNFYFRKCTLEECGHRTKTQKYTPDVEES